VEHLLEFLGGEHDGLRQQPQGVFRFFIENEDGSPRRFERIQRERRLPRLFNRVLTSDRRDTPLGTVIEDCGAATGAASGGRLAIVCRSEPDSEYHAGQNACPPASCSHSAVPCHVPRGGRRAQNSPNPMGSIITEQDRITGTERKPCATCPGEESG